MHRLAPWILLVACASATRPSESEAREAAAHEDRTRVQQVACFVPATKPACDPGLRASVKQGAQAATLWCENGRAFGHFSAFTDRNEERTGEFAAPVWESLWRVVKATDGCIAAYGAVVEVTRSGATQRCDAPRYDVRALFDAAYWTMRHGPPSQPITSPSNGGSICAIDPSACPKAPSSCPPFEGDAWNWLGQGPTPTPTASVSAESEAPIPLPASNSRPAQDAVVGALRAVIPNARRCVVVDTPARAKVVFTSSGKVQSVVVTGVDDRTQTCIIHALEKGVVPPFADPSYETSLTVRP